MSYQSLLAEAPDHLSPEFIDYLRDNNVVVFEDDFWIVIENIKYHSSTQAHHTAFTKKHGIPGVNGIPPWHYRLYPGWEIHIKPSSKRTVQRWHVHFIEDITN